MDIAGAHRTVAQGKGDKMKSRHETSMMMRTAVFIYMLSFLLFSCQSANRKVDFDPRKPDEKKIQQQLSSDADKLRDWKMDDQAKRIQELFYKANLMSTTHDRVDPEKMNDVLTSLRMATKSYLITSGKSNLVKLGIKLVGDFEKEFEAICQQSGKVPGASVALLSGAPVPKAIDKQFKRFTKVGGGFLVVASANGLVKEGKDGTLVADPEARFFIRTAFKVYWANALPQSVKPLDWILSPFERKWYEIWVAEKSKTAPLARKMAALEYLSKEQTDYPAELAKGIILYKAKKYALARKAFELALQKNPHNEKAKIFMAQAANKI